MIPEHYQTPDLANIFDRIEKKENPGYEELFPGLLENLPLGVYRTGIQGEIFYINKGFLRIFGFESEDELRDKNILDFFVNHSERFEIIEKCLTNKEYSFEFKVYRKDKSVIWIKDSCRVIPDKEGNPLLLDGIIEDITERRSFEEKLQESEARLKELNISKDRFFSILSHDLRSPLNQIIGATDLLINKIEDYDKNMILKFLSLLNAEALQSFRLLENLLQWSKNQQGLIHFEPKPVHVISLVNEVYSLHESQAAKKNILIRIKVSKDLYIYADKEMLSTVLRNLVSNAIKFTDEEGEIQISAIQRMDNEQCVNYAEFCVSDNGIGMEQEEISRLFSFTESYTAKGTYNESGTGLGLILCKDFVEKHAGKIWAESAPGLGSKFKFTIY